MKRKLAFSLAGALCLGAVSSKAEGPAALQSSLKLRPSYISWSTYCAGKPRGDAGCAKFREIDAGIPRIRTRDELELFAQQLAQLTFDTPMERFLAVPSGAGEGARRLDPEESRRVAAFAGKVAEALGSQPKVAEPLSVPAEDAADQARLRAEAAAAAQRAKLKAEAQARAQERAKWIVPQERGPFPVIPAVRNYQRIFNALGERMTVDGKAGSDTRAKVADFQRPRGLAREDRPFGVIDPATATALILEFQERFKDKYKLKPTGALDPATMAALAKLEAAKDAGGFDAATIRRYKDPFPEHWLKVDSDGIRSGRCRFTDPDHRDGTSWRFAAGSVPKKRGTSLDACVHKYFVTTRWREIGLFACATRGRRLLACGIMGDHGGSYAEASLAVHEMLGNGPGARNNQTLDAPVEITIFTQGLRTGTVGPETLESQIEELERWFAAGSRSAR